MGESGVDELVQIPLTRIKKLMKLDPDVKQLAGDAIQKIIDVLPKVYQTLFAHCAKEFSADMKSQKPPEWFLKAVGQAGTRQLWLGSVSCYLLFILRAQTIL